MAALGRATIDEPIPGSGHEAVVTALRRALARMGVALAKGVVTMPKGR